MTSHLTEEEITALQESTLHRKAPFIIQISRGARAFTYKRFLEAMIRAAEEIFPEAIFAVHLDHGDEETCYECINSGFFSSVMIDASHEPYDKNVEISKRVVVAAHAKGISVEAELGMLGGVEEDIKVEDGHATLTNPLEAQDFVKQTGTDCLACAIGTSHGAYKFTKKPTGEILAISRIKEINGRLLPFGVFRLLSKKKDIRRIRVVSINVVPEYQRWGLGLALLKSLVPKAHEMGVQEAEFSWISEDNELARRGLEKAGMRLTKTFRMYDYEPSAGSV